MLLLFVAQGYACSCDSERSVKEEFNEQEFIVSGTILSKETITAIDSVEQEKFLKRGVQARKVDKRFTEYSYSKYKLVVTYVYKGTIDVDTLEMP